VYSNIYYDGLTGIIHLWEKSPSDIKPKYSRHVHKPTIYEKLTATALKNKIEPDAEDIHGYPLIKRTFHTEKECRHYVLDNFDTTAGYNSAISTFLLNRYSHMCHEPRMADFKLNLLYWDLETYTPNGVPNPSEFKITPIYSVTFYNNIKDEYVVVCIDASVNEPSGIKKVINNNRVYLICATESILLTTMINYINQIKPDLLIGFNSLEFDFPLFMERAETVIGYENLVKASPINNIRKIKRPDGTFYWKIGGISQADYMELIRKYSYGEYHSYSLDNLSHALLKRPKLPSVYPHHCMNEKGQVTNTELWQKMIQYNMRDVECLPEFETELGYIELSKMIWLRGLSEPEQIYGTISYIDGAISAEIKRLGKIPPNKVINDPPTPPKYPGAWVKEPKKGLSHWVVSFDANSLYPMSIVTLNISLETKVFTIINENVVEDVRKCMNGETVENYKTDVRFNHTTKLINIDVLAKMIKDDSLILSPNGAAYKNKEGIIPRVMNSWYSERKDIQDKLRKARKEKDERSIKWYDTLQYAIKIMLNSTYGATGSKYSTYFELDNAKSVTYAGQAVTRYADYMIEKYFEDNYQITEQCVLYCDTDSAYVDFSKWLDKMGITIDILKHIDLESEKMKEYLNSSYDLFCKKHFNSVKHRYEFKKEVVVDNILFLEKKNYVMHVVEDDGEPKDKLKAKGVELVRSSTPQGIKQFLNDITLIILNGDSRKVITNLQNMRNTFMKMNPYEIAKSSSVNNIELYDMTNEGDKFPKWKKGTPVHVKAAICYNFSTKDKRNEYLEIKSNSKMKWLYIEPNKFDWKVLGFIDEEYPIDLNIKIDYEKQFNATVMGYIKRVFDVLGWSIPNLKIKSISDFF